MSLTHCCCERWICQSATHTYKHTHVHRVIFSFFFPLPLISPQHLVGTIVNTPVDSASWQIEVLSHRGITSHIGLGNWFFYSEKPIEWFFLRQGRRSDSHRDLTCFQCVVMAFEASVEEFIFSFPDLKAGRRPHVCPNITQA